MDQTASQEIEPTSETTAKPAQKVEEGGLLQEFLKYYESLPNSEEKLRQAISFMRTSLAQPSAPYFKGFWEVRKLILPLFKDNLVAHVRTQLWEEYVELTREGRKLKDLIDQESAFAASQIEMAIKALEVEVEGFHHYAEEVLAKTTEIEMPQSQTIKDKRAFYLTTQRRLNLLNTFASHIHALRQELIKTEMRIRHKNRFFERLSLMGDKIFPVRKELIKEVSTAFTEDVARFVEENFSAATFNEDYIRRHVFSYRDEIKALQACAKVITLNTTAFGQTRASLSLCWDKLKGMEKELKKEYTQQKQKSNENVTSVREKLKEIVEAYSSGAIQSQEALKRIDELGRSMRAIELTFHDVKLLKEELRVAKIEPEAKLEEEEKLKKQKESEVEEKKKEQLEQFKARCVTAKETLTAKTHEEMTLELSQLRETLNQMLIPKREREPLERILKEIRNLIEEKKEESLLNLSDESKAALGNFKEILLQRKQRRSEIKAQVEEYRKVIGGSSLDFEKAIEYGELLAQEKERLEKMDESIAEIEAKMNQVKKKC